MQTPESPAHVPAAAAATAIDDGDEPLFTPEPRIESLSVSASDPVATQPGHVALEALSAPVTPAAVTANSAMAVHLPPVSSSPPPQPLLQHQRPQQQYLQPAAKAGPGLRLPSFEALGIAAPHPDQLPPSTVSGQCEAADYRAGGFGLEGDRVGSGGGGVGDANGNSGVGSERSAALRSARGYPVSSSHMPSCRTYLGPSAPMGLSRDVATLTPPAEPDAPAWGSLAPRIGVPLHSPAADAGVIESAASDAATGKDTRPDMVLPMVGLAKAASESSTLASMSPIALAIDELVSGLKHRSSSRGMVKVLSHALPSSSPVGHLYPVILQSIHPSAPDSPTEWINVLHAMSGRFSMSELPTSPPETPGPAFGADDYFTQKVFPSAVPIFDYQQGLSAVPRPSRHTIQPSSIDVSIVERYIPPTNTREFATAFDLAGPSLIIDRLVELSPDDGTLMFIYPTSTGAKTFMKDYLGPVIDPVLRSIMVVNGIADDLAQTLGNMEAVAHLPSFEQAAASMHRLCETLSQPDVNRRHFYGPPTRLEVRIATSAEVALDRTVWAGEWWTKQEKPRIREAMTRAVHEAQKKKSNESVERPSTATELVQQLIEGVARNPVRPDPAPRPAVEVGVFVIRRSLVQ